ncbi:hypothetical protein [Rudaea sp.]
MNPADEDPPGKPHLPFAAPHFDQDSRAVLGALDGAGKKTA